MRGMHCRPIMRRLGIRRRSLSNTAARAAEAAAFVRAALAAIAARCRYLSSMPQLRIALSQFRPTKGEYAENVTRIGAVITQAAQLDPKPELIVFPETATSGYFVEGGVKELAVTAGTLARDLAAAYQGPAIDVVVGFYERFQNHIYNSALYGTLDRQKPEVRHVHRKVFLPTYGVFDEERFVDRGQDGVR